MHPFIVLLLALAAFVPLSSHALEIHRIGFDNDPNTAPTGLIPSRKEIDLIREAVAIMNERAERTNLRVWKCFRENWKRYMHKPGYPALDREYSQKYSDDKEKRIEGRKWLFSAQGHLEQSATDNRLKVHVFNKETPSWGYAKRDFNVEIQYATPNPPDENEFEIYLNTYYMPDEWDYERAVQWAGIIAHEIYHNLGHSHPATKDFDVDYDPTIQINTFQKCLVTNGRWDAKRIERFVCGQP